MNYSTRNTSFLCYEDSMSFFRTNSCIYRDCESFARDMYNHYYFCYRYMKDKCCDPVKRRRVTYGRWTCSFCGNIYCDHSKRERLKCYLYYFFLRKRVTHFEFLYFHIETEEEKENMRLKYIYPSYVSRDSVEGVDIYENLLLEEEHGNTDTESINAYDSSSESESLE